VPSAADADDIIQETSLALWQKFGDFDPQRDFFRWACGVAFVEVLRFRRRTAKDKLWFNDELLELISSELLERKDNRELRREALRECIKKSMLASGNSLMHVTARVRPWKLSPGTWAVLQTQFTECKPLKITHSSMRKWRAEQGWDAAAYSGRVACGAEVTSVSGPSNRQRRGLWLNYFKSTPIITLVPMGGSSSIFGIRCPCSCEVARIECQLNILEEL